MPVASEQANFMIASASERVSPVWLLYTVQSSGYDIRNSLALSLGRR